MWFLVMNERDVKKRTERENEGKYVNVGLIVVAIRVLVVAL